MSNKEQTTKAIVRKGSLGIDVINSKSGFGYLCIGSYKELKNANYPIKDAIANAELFCEAFNVKEETGMSPKELADKVAILTNHAETFASISDVLSTETKGLREQNQQLQERINHLENDNAVLKERNSKLAAQQMGDMDNIETLRGRNATLAARINELEGIISARSLNA